MLLDASGPPPTSNGRRIAYDGDQRTLTDGPFAESKEVVGGYAILEAPSREAAIEATRRFLQLHVEHWPEWEGECELRELVYLAP